MNKRDIIKKQKRVSTPVCRKKQKFDNKMEAWNAAEYNFLRYEKLYDVYKCPCGDHYHLTTNTSLGDMTHFPAHLIDLFKTIEIEPGISFWHKLRKILI